MTHIILHTWSRCLIFVFPILGPFLEGQHNTEVVICPWKAHPRRQVGGPRIYPAQLADSDPGPPLALTLVEWGSQSMTQISVWSELEGAPPSSSP